MLKYFFVFLYIPLISSPEKLVQAAINRTQENVKYDPTYYVIPYPNGDIPKTSGVCTDVIIRSFREALNIDLQHLAHEDMKANFRLYPQLWGLRKPDKNIDHRRVPNLRVFFKRFGQELNISHKAKDYKPGDIVTWNLKPKGSLPHIGIVIDQYTQDKTPLIVHNIGNGPEIEDILFKYDITGHYRYP